MGTEGGQTSSVEDIHLWPKNLHRSPELRAFLCAEANIPPYLVSLRGDAAEGSNVDAGGDDDASRTPTDDQSTDTGGGRSLESRIRKVEDGPRVNTFQHTPDTSMSNLMSEFKLMVVLCVVCVVPGVGWGGRLLECEGDWAGSLRNGAVGAEERRRQILRHEGT